LLRKSSRHLSPWHLIPDPFFPAISLCRISVPI
jgi:hypothetical protein